jgi:hypothetical protein
VQVRANKELCFEAERRQLHIDALVGGLVASGGNELLSTALIEATAALVSEPEMATTSETVHTCAPASGQDIDVDNRYVATSAF